MVRSAHDAVVVTGAIVVVVGAGGATPYTVGLECTVDKGLLTKVDIDRAFGSTGGHGIQHVDWCLSTTLGGDWSDAFNETGEDSWRNL